MYYRYELVVVYKEKVIFSRNFKSVNHCIKIASGFKNNEDIIISIYDDLNGNAINHGMIKELIKEMLV